MNRLFRLLPLASLVLTACSIHTPQGPGKSPDSPQWRQHQQAVRSLNQFQTPGWATRYHFSSGSTGVSISPTPSAKAAWPRTKTGTSAPN